jgi:hypothetical protein
MNKKFWKNYQNFKLFTTNIKRFAKRNFLQILKKILFFVIFYKNKLF